jgi:hypothetical protein
MVLNAEAMADMVSGRAAVAVECSSVCRGARSRSIARLHETEPSDIDRRRFRIERASVAPAGVVAMLRCCVVAD